MNKLYFNARDELTCININLIALVLADGNYSKVVYITKKEIILTYGISKIEEVLKSCNDSQNLFLRMGRSTIINHNYLHKIDLQKSLLILGDGGINEIKINLPKLVLKSYKEAIVKKVKIQGDKKYGRDN